MSTVVMIREYPETPSEQELDNLNQRAASCLEVNASTRVTSYKALDGKNIVCVFEGPDLESVRRALDSAGFVYKHLFSATVY